MGTIFVLHIADVNLSLSCRDRQTDTHTRMHATADNASSFVNS